MSTKGQKSHYIVQSYNRSLFVMGSHVKVGTRTEVKSTSVWDFSIWSISPSLFRVLTSPERFTVLWKLLKYQR